jgi:hypothetical protein
VLAAAALRGWLRRGGAGLPGAPLLQGRPSALPAALQPPACAGPTSELMFNETLIIPPAPPCSMTVRSVCIRGVHPAASDRVLIAHFGACGFIQRISHLRWGVSRLSAVWFFFVCMCVCVCACVCVCVVGVGVGVGGAGGRWSNKMQAAGGKTWRGLSLCLSKANPGSAFAPLRPPCPPPHPPPPLPRRDPISGKRSGVAFMQFAAASQAQAALALDGASLAAPRRARCAGGLVFRCTRLPAVAGPSSPLAPADQHALPPTTPVPPAGSSLLQRSIRVVPSDSPAARVAAARVLRAAHPPPVPVPLPMLAGGWAPSSPHWLALLGRLPWSNGCTCPGRPGALGHPLTAPLAAPPRRCSTHRPSRGEPRAGPRRQRSRPWRPRPRQLQVRATRRPTGPWLASRRRGCSWHRKWAAWRGGPSCWRRRSCNGRLTPFPILCAPRGSTRVSSTACDMPL